MGSVLTENADEFNEEDTRWFCCLRKLHIKTAMIGVGIIHLAMFAVFFLIMISAAAHETSYETDADFKSAKHAMIILISTILLSLVCAVFAALLFGLRRERRYFLIPYIVLTSFEVIAVFIYWLGIGSYTILALADPNVHLRRLLYVRIVLLTFVLPVAIIIVHSCFIWVAWRCYFYLDKKHTAQMMGLDIVRYTVAIPESTANQGQLSFQNPSYPRTSEEPTTTTTESSDKTAANGHDTETNQ